MPKTKTTAAAAQLDPANLRLGELVYVVVASGVQLINNESRGYFQPGVRTPQTVTPTLLRRLRDGDLSLVA